ncbi:hypothetical protein EDB80DRAFT_882189 [Ilyonectria destructans]|nr:hypothetical protein EDB80DRAFT_882189 [Ilyonectria destructans]
MNHAIDKTVWPAATLNNGVKDLITKFYQLADSKQPDAGARMASEVFSKDATLLSPNGTFQGSSEIAKSRDNAWAVVNLREHRVLQVFTSHENRLELVVLGTLNTGFKNGNFLDSPFASHMTIEESSIDSGDPRLRRMQVFADTAPMAAMLTK